MSGRQQFLNNTSSTVTIGGKAPSSPKKVRIVERHTRLFALGSPTPDVPLLLSSSPRLLQSQKKQKKIKFRIKEHVEAQRKSSKLWRAAVIRRIHTNGTYDIIWEDTQDKER
jgi:hypothetical protein